MHDDVSWIGLHFLKVSTDLSIHLRKPSVGHLACEDAFDNGHILPDTSLFHKGHFEQSQGLGCQTLKFCIIYVLFVPD